MVRPASALFDHKVGALGGGSDLEAGSYTLHDAWLHALKMPACVGFTYQGAPNQQGKVQCYFKSSQAGNADPNWQTYLKRSGADAAHVGGGAAHVASAHAHQAQAAAQAQQTAVMQAQAAAQAQQAAMMQAQQAQQVAASMQPAPQVCPQCEGTGGLGTFGPVPRGHMHWKKECLNCNGLGKTINTIPCPACKSKGGHGTFGPCGLMDIHFKSACGACRGQGYSAPLGAPPAAVAVHPVVMAQAVPALAPGPATAVSQLIVIHKERVCVCVCARALGGRVDA